MRQKTFDFNCPYCGKITEAVSPDTKHKVERLLAKKDSRTRILGKQPNIVTSFGCPNCQQGVYLHWFYKPKFSDGIFD